MKAKRTFVKIASQAARSYYSAGPKADISDWQWMEVQKRIRKNLIMVREGYGMSQKHCADVLGLNPKYMNAMERGRYYPSLRCVWLFSQFFHIPIGLLVEREWSEDEAKIWSDELRKMNQLNNI